MSKVIHEISFVLVIILMSTIGYGQQGFNIGIGVGMSTYNGDVSHHGPTYGGEESNESIAIAIGYDVNEDFKIKGTLLSTKLQGADKFATNAGLKMRNLSFYSRVNEMAITTEYHFLPTLNIKSRVFSPYIEAGVGIFYFNPKTKLDGREYELQGLSTEGQGLPGNDTSPYQLIEMNLQFGGGLAFKINENLRISLSSLIRLTSTDYIDDVSGNYYNLDDLAKFKGENAALLAYRGSDDINNLPNLGGQPRGNPSNNDSYIIHQLSFTYIFNSEE